MGSGVAVTRLPLEQEFEGSNPSSPDITYNTIIKIESGGIQSPTIDTVQKIAKALGVGLENLTK